jgi:hypothetical protein
LANSKGVLNLRLTQPLKLVRIACISVNRYVPSPTIVLSIPETVPANVGDAKFAFNPKVRSLSSRRNWFIACIAGVIYI